MPIKKVMENYSTQERRADIIHILNQKNRVMISELCERYGLSEVTIRKRSGNFKKTQLTFQNSRWINPYSINS